MKIFLLLLLLPSLAHADFIASAGLLGSEVTSQNKSDNGKAALSAPTVIGFRGEAEFIFSYFSLFGSFDIGTGKAKTEYNYTSPTDPLDTAEVSGLKTTLVMSRFTLGTRIRIIKLKHFRMFVGGGLEYGIMSLVYDEDDFTSSVGSSKGLKETERQTLKGSFAQAGMEFIIDNLSGIRLQAQKDYFRTDGFETINEKQLKLSPLTFSLAFIQYVDM